MKNAQMPTVKDNGIKEVLSTKVWQQPVLKAKFGSIVRTLMVFATLFVVSPMLVPVFAQAKKDTVATVQTVKKIIYNRSDYKKKPLWIDMMKDPTVNFNETVRAFREYYKERILPNEPGEVEGHDDFEKQVGLEDKDGDSNGKSERERERERQRKRKKHGLNERNYAFEARVFRGWFYNTKMWVRPDGSIISAKERQSMIDKQQNELKEIEKANGKN